MSTMEAQQETRTISSNSTNRCDRCGAQAYALVVLATAQSLMFCGHHWAAVRLVLEPVAATVIDETNHIVSDGDLTPVVVD